MIGISGAFNSINTLSMPMADKADMMCSIVPTRTPDSVTMVDERRVSLINMGDKGMISPCSPSKSVRRKRMPVSTSAGCMVKLTRSPECRPTPVTCTEDAKVLCNINRIYLFIWNDFSPVSQQTGLILATPL